MPALTLYGRATSSCTARLRIALALKRLPYTPVYVTRSQQVDPTVRYAAVNPALTVPTLEVADPDGSPSLSPSAPSSPSPAPLRITQSVAALEFLEDAFPATEVTAALLPPPGARAARARVRALVELIVSDVQPRQAVQTLRVLDGVLPAGADAGAARRRWAHAFCVDGFAAYEKLMAEAARDAGDEGPFSVGGAPSLADCCLVPMVWNATERWGVDLQAFPRVARAYASMMALPAVAGAHWRQQPDALDADA